MKKSYVIVDEEVSGISTKLEDSSQLIRLTAVKVDEEFNVIDNFDMFIKPEEKVIEMIEDLTGITNEMLELENNEKYVVEKFLNFTKDCLFIGWNLPFTLDFLLKAIYKYDIEDYEIKGIDTTDLFLATNKSKKEAKRKMKQLQFKIEEAIDRSIFVVKDTMEIDGLNNLNEFFDKYSKKNMVHYQGINADLIPTKLELKHGKVFQIYIINRNKDKFINYCTNGRNLRKKEITFYEYLLIREKKCESFIWFNVISDFNHKYFDYAYISGDFVVTEDKCNNYKKALDTIDKNKMKMVCFDNRDKLNESYKLLGEKYLNIIEKNLIDNIAGIDEINL